MSKNNLIAALDIGSSKVTAIAVDYDADLKSLKVVAGKSVPCHGFKRGMVSDLREASASVAEAIDFLEEKAGQDVGALYVALRGDYLDSLPSHGAHNLSRVREITGEDIDQAIANASSLPIKNDQELISVVPQKYLVDRRGVDTPEGLEGSLLEVDVFITKGMRATVNNLMNAITRSGFRVDGKFYGLACLPEGVLSKDENEGYCLMLDLGGDTISVGIWNGCGFVYAKDFPFGCDLLTRDIANILHTTKAGAIEIKERYGVAYPVNLDEDSTIEVRSIDGKTTTEIKRSYLMDIIKMRLEELFGIINENIKKAGYSGAIQQGGAILTGGGSLMSGIEALVCQCFGVKEAHRATVRPDLVQAEEKYFDPMYTTALSLAIYAAKVEKINDGAVSGISGRSGGFSKFFNFLKNTNIFGG